MSCCSSSQRPALEVADIFRDHRDRLENIGRDQWKVVNALISCRTAKLGGHVYECDHCGHRENRYNSCRNRHCPKCQALVKAKWLQERMKELLPVPYFHVVFTLPDIFNPIALCNKKVAYDLLFQAVKETLLEAARNPKNLGARVGFVAVLHTWGQNLLDHPHIHCVVPGGGLSADCTRWISCRKDFFLPVKILSSLFRGKFLHYLKKAYVHNTLIFPGKIKEFSDQHNFHKLIDHGYAKPWVVYSKRPFAGPKQVLDYLGRYTHRVAISNHRIRAYEDRKVSFTWKDYKHHHARKLMTLTADEFMRRFLLHVVPKRFVRIRSYGFLSNTHKGTLLPLCRELTGDTTEVLEDDTPPESWQELLCRLAGRDCFLCPECGQGRMVDIAEILPGETFENGTFFDTS
jgi:hypothetical protein